MAKFDGYKAGDRIIINAGLIKDMRGRVIRVDGEYIGFNTIERYTFGGLSYNPTETYYISNEDVVRHDRNIKIEYSGFF